MRHESGLEEFLNLKIHPKDNFIFETPFMIDSLYMKEHHRQQVLEAVEKSPYDKILISHGTDSMTETAEYLLKNLPAINKTIILFGAMFPLEGFYHSDASFNMGYAIAEIKSRPHGIYICMNGHTFNAGKVVKNTEVGQFEDK